MKHFGSETAVQTAIETYHQDGGFVFQNFVELSDVHKINDYLDQKGSSYKQLYFDAPWGYGNMLETECTQPVLSQPWFNAFSKSLFGHKTNHNHLVCNEKTDFVGYEVEWHQEVYNINTFSPGCSPEEAHKFFVQAFIALDDQGPDNGGLLVMPGSNKLGVLDSVDVLSPALTHKRSVSQSGMRAAAQDCHIVCPTLKPGDALIFSPLLIHGSLRNVSDERRRSLVLQAASTAAPARNEVVYNSETEYRRNFVLRTLQSQIDKISQTNLYSELKAK